MYLYSRWFYLKQVIISFMVYINFTDGQIVKLVFFKCCDKKKLIFYTFYALLKIGSIRPPRDYER